MITAVAADAKEIRQTLKKRFPLTKFSVRSKPYSMGSSIYVNWLDGPTQKEVEAITNKKRQVSRDGNGEILSGGNQFVSCSRHYSEAVYRAAAEKMKPWTNWEHVDFEAIEYGVSDDGSCYLKGNIRDANDTYLARQYRSVKEKSVGFANAIMRHPAYYLRPMRAYPNSIAWHGRSIGCT